MLRHDTVGEILDSVIASLRGGRDAASRDQRADAQPRADVARALGRHLPGAVRVPHRSTGGSDAEVRTARVRAPGARVWNQVLRVTVGRARDAHQRRRRHYARPAALRPQRLGTTLARACAQVPPTVRRRDPQRLRPDRARGRSSGLERGRVEGVRPRETRRSRPPARGVPTPRSHRVGRGRRHRRSRRARDPFRRRAPGRRRRDGGSRHPRRLAPHG